jgi:uncharacterized protein (DUF1778 family)
LAVQAATWHAREALADRRLFAVSAERWDGFVAALSQPVDRPEVLDDLFDNTPTRPPRA